MVYISFSEYFDDLDELVTGPEITPDEITPEKENFRYSGVIS